LAAPNAANHQTPLIIINEAKKYWEELAAGKYEWSSIGKQLRQKGIVREMVYIHGDALRQVDSVREVVPGTFYVNAVNEQLYIGDNPAGKTVEATAQTRAFGLWQGGMSNPRGTVVGSWALPTIPIWGSTCKHLG
jgi:hypothetical protein